MGDTRYDQVVVGGGPMGASAARYLAEAGRRVMLLAPRDPATSVEGAGLPSSHADLSRVTRRLDADAHWARLAAESVARYRALEKASGVPFYTESGCLTVVEGNDQRAEEQLAAFARVGSALGVPHHRLAGAELDARFPFLEVAPGSTVLHEDANAGWLDPRAYVRAQIAVGVAHGLDVAYEPMATAHLADDGATLVTQSGSTVRGDHAVFAMGPYSAFDLPIADRQELVVYARTVVHVRLSDEQLRELGTMPSMIVRGLVDEQNCYILPPAQYPDGHWYIKIGGGRRAQRILTRAELQDWFAGPGDPVLGAALRERLEQLLPATRGGSATTQACAITVTENAHPRIARLSRRATLLTGGNGHAAKSGDEIGRLAAGMLLGRVDWSADYPVGTFSS